MEKAKVFYFNPTCELAVANGSFSYMPPLLLQEMEKDLSILPFAYANENDIILTENPHSEDFLQSLRLAGFKLPEFSRLNDLRAMPDHSFDSIIPWGWSPAVHFKLKELKEKCSNEFKRSTIFNWKEEHQLLYERSTSLDFLTEILNDNPPNWFIDRTFCGVKMGSCDEIESFLKIHSAIVLKAPMSSSGRGIQIVRNSKLNTSNKQWISGVLKQQKYLIAEPFLEKIIDLSFQFQVSDNSEVIYLGYSIFETNSNGQYNGTLIHPDLQSLLPKEDFRELLEKIEITANILRKALTKSEYQKYYRGYLGVDALIFRNQNQLLMQPCIEVNCRMNMGILCLQLENKIHKDASGRFDLFFAKSGDFLNYAKINSEINKPKYKEGKIHSGFLPLIEPHSNTKFGAYITLGSAK